MPRLERRIHRAVHYPSPAGYITVPRADVDAHWGTRSVEDALVPGRPLSAQDQERHRFFYTVVVKMREAGHLTADNQPSAEARAETKAAIAAIPMPDEVTLRDLFAPDALDPPPLPRIADAGAEGGGGDDLATPRPVAATLAPGPPTSPPASLAQASINEDAKSRLGRKYPAQAASASLTYHTEREGPAHAPHFRATVRVVVGGELREFVGEWSSTRKAAEQSAAAAALRFIDVPAAVGPSGC